MSALLEYAEPAASFYTLSPGRIGAIVGGLLGLSGIVFGALGLLRPNRDSRPRRAVIALTAGLTGMAIGALVVATSDEGIGTGNGRAGAYVALIVGLIAVVLGGLAWARVRRAAH